MLHCVLLEIVLNAGSVALEGAATSHGGVLSRGDRTPPCCAVRSAWIGEALADRIVSYRIVSYRIAIFCLISYRIYRFLLKLYRAITTKFGRTIRPNVRLGSARQHVTIRPKLGQTSAKIWRHLRICFRGILRSHRR